MSQLQMIKSIKIISKILHIGVLNGIINFITLTRCSNSNSSLCNRQVRAETFGNDKKIETIIEGEKIG